jgi:hypothetical protein
MSDVRPGVRALQTFIAPVASPPRGECGRHPASRAVAFSTRHGLQGQSVADASATFASSASRYSGFRSPARVVRSTVLRGGWGASSTLIAPAGLARAAIGVLDHGGDPAEHRCRGARDRSPRAEAGRQGWRGRRRHRRPQSWGHRFVRSDLRRLSGPEDRTSEGKGRRARSRRTPRRARRARTPRTPRKAPRTRDGPKVAPAG